MQPRFDDSPQNTSNISDWYLPLMIGAAVVLSVLFARRWWVVGPGLVALQLAVALFTTPQGDNDGLWVLIMPMLVVFAIVLTALCGVVGIGMGYLRGLGRSGRHA